MSTLGARGRAVVLGSTALLLSLPLAAQQGGTEANKALARQFYEDLWFNDNTDRYADHVADEYVIHDIGGREGGTERAIRQKEIADFFWSNGSMSGRIDYQIAEGDLVATRWYWTFEPTSILGHFMVGDITIPIINVFRIEDGKITEIWNHRHDIDTNRTNIHLVKGLGIGLAIALLLLVWALRLRGKLKRATAAG